MSSGPNRARLGAEARAAGRASAALATALFVALAPTACRRRVSPVQDASPDAVVSERPGQGTAPAAPPPCARVPGSFAEVTARLSPALVTLLGPEGSTTAPGDALPLAPGAASGEPPPAPPAGGEEPRVPLGAGFVVDGERLVVTSAEVAGDAPGLVVRLADGRQVDATLRGVDPELDLAVLVLDEPIHQAVAMTECARLRPGDWVAVLADPFGAGATVTVGVVRSMPVGDEANEAVGPAGQFIAVDAAVDAANRGGAVVDAAARLVGMAVTAPGGGSRMSLVLPAGELRRAAAELLEHGESPRAWIGLWVRPLEPDAARELGLSPPRGLLATRIVEGGPADLAGIRAGDVVVEFSGEPVATPSRLGLLASRAPAGQPVPIVVFREGRHEELQLRPASMPQ